MERIKQQLSVARKQRERLQQGEAPSTEDEEHQPQDAFSQQLSLDRKQRERLQQGQAPSAEDEGHQQEYAYRSKKNRNTTVKDNTMRLFLGMTILVVSVMITWWGISSQQTSEIQLSTSPLPDPPQISATRSTAIDRLEVRITGLVQRIDSLTDSITFLESKLMSAHLITDSIMGADKQLASATISERHSMADRAEQQINGMSAPSADDSIEPAEQQAMAEAEQNNEALASSADDSIEPTEEQLMAEAEQIMAEAEQLLEMSPPAAGHPGSDTRAVTTIEQPSDGTMQQDAMAATVTNDTSASGVPDTMLSEPPAAAAPDTDAVASGQASNQTVVAMASKAEVLEPQDPVSKQQPAVSLDTKKGPWVINLVSTPSKAEADRLAKKARSRDIQTELQQATVKGTEYWRVQITGFSTADEARAYGDTAKKKLGMKDVWIMKN